MRFRTNATLQTLLLIVAVFAAQLIGAVAYQWPTEMFAFALPVEDNPWTVITSIYAHAGLGHLLGNAVGLLIFGLLIERHTTLPRFHSFFVLTGVTAAAAEVAFGAAFGGSVAVLGASGAVFALMGYVLASNVAADSLLGVIELGWKGKVVAAFLVAALITVATAGEQVALVAHFTGLLLGLIAGRFRLLRA